jgi:hypothetical protein
MPDIVERLIELISESSPLEERVSGVVAGMIEKTASRLARFETAPSEDQSLIDDSGPQAA